MAQSVRETRRNDIDALYQQIEGLLVRRTFLPPGRLRDLLDERVEEKFAEIDKLNEPTFFESSLGQRIAMAASVACVLVGLAMGYYPLITGGVVIALVALMKLSGSPEFSKDNVRRWEP